MDDELNKRLRNTWAGMKRRCTNPADRSYKSYGGRGISVCIEWRQFDRFRFWALNAGYRPGLTIDRIDVNGNYEPSNCRWATQKEQQNNRTNNRRITIDGVTKTLNQWAEAYGANETRVRQQLDRGWTLERALGMVPDPNRVVIVPPTRPMNQKPRKGIKKPIRYSCGNCVKVYANLGALRTHRAKYHAMQLTTNSEAKHE
jgi:hypothetical protein